MMRTLLPMALLGLMLAAPLALAQENEEQPPTNESQDAWVKDCPPDMMCAYGGSEGECLDCEKNATSGDEPTYGGCDGEVCAYGDEGCIECSGPVDSGTCMDGQQEGEACRGADCENCRTLTGGAPEPATGAGAPEAASDDAKTVPGFAAGLVFAAMAVAVIVVARRS